MWGTYNSVYASGRVWNVAGKSMDIKTYSELIKSHRFRRPSDGIDVVIGLPREQQKILGIMYESWDELTDSLNRLTDELWNANKALKEMTKKYNEFSDIVSNGTIWQRMKYLFTKHF